MRLCEVQVPLQLPDLEREAGHTVQLLVPVSRPGQVHLTARLQYHTGQVRHPTTCSTCFGCGQSVCIGVFLHWGDGFTSFQFRNVHFDSELSSLSHWKWLGTVPTRFYIVEMVGSLQGQTKLSDQAVRPNLLSDQKTCLIAIGFVCRSQQKYVSSWPGWRWLSSSPLP